MQDAILALAIYFIVWWLALFIVLPWNLRPNSNGEGDDEKPVPGQERGAPANPQIKRKMGIATVLAFVFTALIMVNMRFGWIGVNSLDWLFGDI